MDTKIIDLMSLDEAKRHKAYAEAAQIIRAGGLVAFPTETVYGLGANALDADASAKIYAAKGRPSDNPLIAHIAKEEQLYEIVQEVPEKAVTLMKAYWPGPLTMIFKKKEIVPLGTTGGLDTVAVRMPGHPVALQLIEAAGVPIAAPSANISGRPSPTSAARTAEDMNGKIEMILDGGICELGLESTIVDMTEEIPVILRPGFITYEMLTKLLGEVKVDRPKENQNPDTFVPKAPGQKYCHYAPKAPMTLISGDVQKVVNKIQELTAEAVQEGKKVGIVCTDETEAFYQNAIVKSAGSRNKMESVAHRLYEILRGFDDRKVDVIFSETFGNDNLGNAIMNRMMKAAGHREIHV